MPRESGSRIFALSHRGAVFLSFEARPGSFLCDIRRSKLFVVSAGEKNYTGLVMNAALANSYRWYRFTWNPSRRRGAFL